MARSNCWVCDSCGKHKPDTTLSFPSGGAPPPVGWVTIHVGDPAVAAYVFCSLECANKFNEVTVIAARKDTF